MSNILFCSGAPFDPQKGGIEKVSSLLASQFVKNNKVYFISRRGSREGIYPNEFFLPNHDIFLSEENFNYYQKLITDNQIDIIINQYGLSWDESNFFLKKFHFNRKIKYFSVLHSRPMQVYDRLFEIFVIKANIPLAKKIKRFVFFPILKYIYLKNKKKLFRFISSNSDYVVTLSDAFSSQLEKYKISDNVISINNPAIPLIKEYEIEYDERDNVILWVGRLDEVEKCPMEMLHIWKILQEQKATQGWKLVFLGDGKDRIYMEKFIIENKLSSVELKGFVQPDIYMSKAKIICNTSAIEGWGMSIIEGMTHGLVPISYDCNEAFCEIFPHEYYNNIIPYGDRLLFSQRLLKYMSDQKQSKKASTIFKHQVEKFSIDKIAKEWEYLFDKS